VLIRRSLIEKNRFIVLKPDALKFALEPGEDYARPGNSPPARALQVLSCAYDLAIELGRSGLPTMDRRIQRKASKWVVQDIIYRSGPVAVNVLAVALPKILAKTGGNLDGAITGRVASVEQHERLRVAVEDFFPLMGQIKTNADAGLAEYEVMETKKPRTEVAEGNELGSAYSEALVRGDDPDEDPQLVAEQRRWAMDYFISVTTYYSIQLLIELDFPKIKDKMTGFLELEGQEREEFRERLLGAWVRGSKPYMDYALLDEEE
jgi:hypothetical protein